MFVLATLLLLLLLESLRITQTLYRKASPTCQINNLSSLLQLLLKHSDTIDL